MLSDGVSPHDALSLHNLFKSKKWRKRIGIEKDFQEMDLDCLSDFLLFDAPKYGVDWVFSRGRLSDRAPIMEEEDESAFNDDWHGFDSDARAHVLINAHARKYARVHGKGRHKNRRNDTKRHLSARYGLKWWIKEIRHTNARNKQQDQEDVLV